jgi:hypothetical protein
MTRALVVTLLAALPIVAQTKAVYKFAIVKPVTTEPMVWKDKDLAVVLDSDGTWVSLVIANESSSVARLIWNDRTFSDTAGKSSKLISGETIRMDMDRAKQDAVILPGATYEARAFPRANMLSIVSPPILAAFVPVNCPKCADAIGKTFQVYLPVQLGDARRDLLFQVKVVDAK